MLYFNPNILKIKLNISRKKLLVLHNFQNAYSVPIMKFNNLQEYIKKLFVFIIKSRNSHHLYFRIIAFLRKKI